jgi:hypothetical protein
MKKILLIATAIGFCLSSNSNAFTTTQAITGVLCTASALVMGALGLQKTFARHVQESRDIFNLVHIVQGINQYPINMFNEPLSKHRKLLPKHLQNSDKITLKCWPAADSDLVVLHNWPTSHPRQEAFNRDILLKFFGSEVCLYEKNQIERYGITVSFEQIEEVFQRHMRQNSLKQLLNSFAAGATLGAVVGYAVICGGIYLKNKIIE